MYIMCMVGAKCFAAAGPGPMGPGPTFFRGPGPAAAKHLAPTMHMMYVFCTIIVIMLYFPCNYFVIIL